jgi:uncharacterized membrane protein
MIDKELERFDEVKEDVIDLGIEVEELQEQEEEEINTIRDTNTQERWKSPVFWVGVFTNLMFVAKLMGWLEPLGIDEVEYNGLVTAITALINIVVGANNPSKKHGF